MTRYVLKLASFDGLSNFNFDLSKGYTYCGVCGALYQSPLQEPKATEDRRKWSFRHARTHKLVEHAELAKSGRHVTREAALKLMPYGIISLEDMVLDDELSKALQKASSTPTRDVEGVEE